MVLERTQTVADPHCSRDNGFDSDGGNDVPMPVAPAPTSPLTPHTSSVVVD